MAVFVAAQLAGLLAVATWVVGEELHDAPLAVVAPPVVGQTLAERAAADPADTFDVVRPHDVDEARALLSTGSVVGAVVVDLTRDQDMLLLRRGDMPALRSAVLDGVRAESARLGRGVRVVDVGPATPPGERRAPDLLPVVAVAAGILTSGVLTVRAGRLPRTWRGARRRLVRVVASSALVGVAVGTVGTLLASGPLVGWWVVCGAVVLTGALVSQALESVLDVWGWGLAVSVMVLTSLPVLAGTDLWAQPVLWRELAGLLPHTAGADLAHALNDSRGADPWRGVAVLGAWLVAASVTSALARHERDDT